MSLRATDRPSLLATVTAWLEQLPSENPQVMGLERDPDVDRWYIRIAGDEKAIITVWLTVGEQVVHVESYFMPWPEERCAEVFEYLLRTSARFFGVRFCIGVEDAVYLRGELPLSSLREGAGAGQPQAELDRILGAVVQYSEESFRAAMTLGFGDRFRPRVAVARPADGS